MTGRNETMRIEMLYTKLQPRMGLEPKGIVQDALPRAFGHALERATGTEGES
jgi:hypothetical protein